MLYVRHLVCDIINDALEIVVMCFLDYDKEWRGQAFDIKMRNMECKKIVEYISTGFKNLCEKL